MNSPFFTDVTGSFTVVMLFMAGLILLKVVASSSTNGAGGVGGIFAPTLFIGGIKWIFCIGYAETVPQYRSSR